MNNKGVVLLPIILGIVALIIVGVVLISTTKPSKSPPSIKTTVFPTSQPVTPTHQPPTEVPESWKTYTHSKFKYIFDYPPNWNVEIAGYSQEEPEGFPYVNKKDGSYKSIIFTYFKETETNKFETPNTVQTTINNLETYVLDKGFGGDHIFKSFSFKISENEYITARMPVDDPNIPIKPDSDDVKTAEKIIRTFRVVK